MRAAAVLLALTAALVLAGGAAYSAAEHVSYGLGLWFALVTAATVGYGDVSPRTAAGHAVSVVLMLTAIPALAAVFARVSAVHAARVWHRRHGQEIAGHAEAARRIAADLYRRHTGEDHPSALPEPYKEA